MTIFMFANNVDTTLAGPISPSATSLTLASTAFLPTSIPAGQVLVIALNDQATRQNFEIIYATAISGATLSGLLRGQEGTSALSWSTGDYAYSAPTAGQQGNFGQLPKDNSWTGSNTFTQPILAASGQLSGLIGAMRNAKMSVASASATSSWSADEVVLESALGGLRYCIPNASGSINLAATGAGGMDTGTAPISGFVAIYGIYNPSTSTFNLLATNATSSAAPSIYAGGHMPPGYTASALLAVWPTNSSGQFVPGYQADREFWFTNTAAINGGTATSYTSVSISSIVPANAKTIEGIVYTFGSVASICYIAGSSSGIGEKQVGGYTGSFEPPIAPFSNVPLITPQTFYYKQSGSTGVSIYLTGYTI